jgi:hypothetical protein
MARHTATVSAGALVLRPSFSPSWALLLSFPIPYSARLLATRDTPAAVTSKAKVPPAAKAAAQGEPPPSSRPPPPVGGSVVGVGTGVSVTTGVGVTAGGVGVTAASSQITSTLCRPDAHSGDGVQT